jgi:hypothetical protein
MTVVTETREPAVTTYRFGTGAPSGVWLGLGLSRLAILAAGLLVSVGLLVGRAGLPIALLPILVSASVTLLPVAGRPLSSWVAPASGHARGGASGSTRWTATPHVGVAVDGGCVAASRLRLPPECGRWELVEVTDAAGGWPVALLREARTASTTVVLGVAGPDRFGLLDGDGQERVLAGWGRTLIALAQRDRGTARVQLVERVTAVEPDVDEARTWAAGRGDGAGDELSSLAASVDAVTVRRDSLLAVQLGRLPDPRQAVSRAREIATQLLSAELVARPVDRDELASLLCRQFTPGLPLPSTDGVGPVSRRVGWDHVRTDDCWHRSFAVTAWPGAAVPANWMSGLLLATPPAGVWTTAVHLAAVAPEVATRLARAARAKAELDRADRARLGLSASAAADKAITESAGMDAELVAGHATHRLAAVLTCTAGSVDELADCARMLRDTAAAAGLTVRPLHGQHHLGLAATLPLCRLRLGGVA